MILAVSRAGAQQALDIEAWAAKVSVSSYTPNFAKITIMCNCFYKIS